MFGLSITKSYLRELASCATSDFLNNRTPLTEAVVKVAAACEKDLTAEHVRRICEMTYHDTYERMHKEAAAADRYISFDPPDPTTAIGMLRARRVESPEKVAEAPTGQGFTMDKVASNFGRTKFRPANAFDELMQTVPQTRERFDFSKLASIRRDLKEAVSAMATEYSGAQMSADIEMSTLLKEASAAYREGHSIREILHACVSGADLSTVPLEIATKTASAVAEKLAKDVDRVVGLGLNKTASLGDVDPDHPLPIRFQKAAQAATQRAHLEITLGDLMADRDRVNKEIRSLYE
jgi:hypothetical protein